MISLVYLQVCGRDSCNCQMVTRGKIWKSRGEINAFSGNDSLA